MIDLLVVGGGPGGLATATHAAQAGRLPIAAGVLLPARGGGGGPWHVSCGMYVGSYGGWG